MRKLSAFVVAGAMAMSLAACGSSDTAETTAATTAAATTAAETTSEETTAAESAEETTAAEAETEAPADLSGSISMVGTTTMET